MDRFAKTTSQYLLSVAAFSLVGLQSMAQPKPVPSRYAPLAEIVKAACGPQVRELDLKSGYISAYETAPDELKNTPFQGITLFEFFRREILVADSTLAGRNPVDMLKSAKPFGVHQLAYAFHYNEGGFRVFFMRNLSQHVKSLGPVWVRILSPTKLGKTFDSENTVWASGTRVVQDGFSNTLSAFENRHGFWYGASPEAQVFSRPVSVLKFNIQSGSSGSNLLSMARIPFALEIKSVRVFLDSKGMYYDILNPVDIRAGMLEPINGLEIARGLSGFIQSLEHARNAHCRN